MSRTWIKKRKREYYYKKAKREKYRSRAAYKLLQAAKRYRFIKPGDVVVDLGAAPGGWMQAIQKIVGDEGFVLGVDLKPIEAFSESNIRTIICDIREPETLQLIQEFLPRNADVVVSDAAPDVSGIWELDHARQIDLARHSLRIATSILRPRGHFFVKVFQGDLLNGFVKQVGQNFTFVRRIKPKASRPESAEMYVLGMKLKRK